MFVKVEDGEAKFTVDNLRVHDYAPEGTGFPRDCTDTDLTEFSFFKVTPVSPPDFSETETLVQNLPVFIYGEWRQSWSIRDLTPEELLQKNPLPKSVTPAQAKGALKLAGLLETVEEVVNEHPYPLVKIYWDYALEFDRSNAYIQALGQELSFDVDDLFRQASEISL